MKVMILAAGRGTRMQALTEQLPKPLLPINGIPIIGHLLTRLAQQGFKDIVINIAYLADKFYATLGDGSAYGVRIQYSHESTALETGGGIFNALPLLGDAPFMVVNGDLWTTYPFATLAQRTIKLAHLVMVDNPWHNPAGDFYLAGEQIVIEGTRTLNFSGIGVYHSALFQDCQAGNFRLGPLLQQAISRGQVTGEHYRGEWVNIGTPEQLQQLQGTT